MKIIISGGHLTPALALIDFIQKNHPQDEIIFVGRIFSQTKLQQLAQEKKEVQKRNLKFIPLDSIRTPRESSLLTKITALPKLGYAIFSAWKIFFQEKPTVFVSFGGYLAIPLAVAAKLTKTPLVTHEQTQAAGFANQIIGKIAHKIAISHQSSVKYFPQHKIVHTGNLIRDELLAKTPPQPNWIKQLPHHPILLITGGNQGSQLINQIVGKLLPILTKKWTIIHLCGRLHQAQNYQQELQQLASKLPSNQQKNYFVQEWVDAKDMAWIYQHAHLAVSRAGANTLMELTLHNIPTIFIPLPFSHHSEQLKNAQFLVNQQAGEIILQSQFTPKKLLQKIAVLEKNHALLRKNLLKIKPPIDAAASLYQLLLEVIHHET